MTLEGITVKHKCLKVSKQGMDEASRTTFTQLCTLVMSVLLISATKHSCTSASSWANLYIKCNMHTCMSFCLAYHTSVKQYTQVSISVYYFKSRMFIHRLPCKLLTYWGVQYYSLIIALMSFTPPCCCLIMSDIQLRNEYKECQVGYKK